MQRPDDLLHAALCAGVAFGQTRPRWILPHGGRVTVDGAAPRVHADYR